MKSLVLKIALAISLGSLVVLLAIWWINGREDNLIYASFALIVLTSIFSLLLQKNKDR